MAEDRLTNSLLNLGYQRLNSNSEGIYFFYRADLLKLSVVSVLHVVTGNEITIEQYEHILDQIKNYFKDREPLRLELLSLIFTRDLAHTKQLCIEAKEDTHWLIDLSTKRVIIYENQATDFDGLRAVIERYLEETPQLDQKENQMPNRLTKTVTLMNTTIIIINIIAYIILHYTPLFGGEDPMLTKGALSWYYIKEGKEYYRFLTSMFMHADWSHIFNNMLVLLFLGGSLERAIGKVKYLFLYFGTGILAGITSVGYNMWKEYGQVVFENTAFSVGASGAIFGVVGAVLFIVIINRGRLEDINTRQMIFFVVLSLYNGIANSKIDQAAHVGGFLAGLLLAAIIYRRPKRTSPAVAV